MSNLKIGKSSRVSVDKEYVISFIHPYSEQTKPEIFKSDYIIGAVEKFFQDSQLEDFFNEKLSKTKISPTTKYETYETGSRYPTSRRQYWFRDGLKCEILKLGEKVWKKGRFRINISINFEFVIDQEEREILGENNVISPLDKIRQVVAQQ